MLVAALAFWRRRRGLGQTQRATQAKIFGGNDTHDGKHVAEMQVNANAFTSAADAGNCDIQQRTMPDTALRASDADLARNDYLESSPTARIAAIAKKKNLSDALKICDFDIQNYGLEWD